MILLAACIILAVHDGDTLTAKCDKRVRPIVVRVAEIDAPEEPAFTWGKQPGADEAKAAAIAICPVGGAAKVRLYKYDGRTRRWIAYVECGGKDLSTQLVAQGYAWAYLTAKKSDMPALMKAAQDQQVNLWAPGLNSIAPTLWRSKSMHQPAK